MKLSRLKILWEKYSKLKVFSSVFGVSFALLFVVVLFGVPHAAHAGIVSWFTDLVGSAADATFGAVFKGVGYVILMLANFILWIVGMLFNYVVVNTVFNFGSYFGNSAGLIAGWGVLRDIANILLIFGFVMLGLAVILDIHGYEVKKTLPRLIIFAILLNFSLLATEAVIDTANAFASIFYSQASTLCSGTAQDCASKGTDSGGISGIVTQMSGIATVFSPDTSGGSADSNKDGGGDEASNTTKGIAYIGMAIFVTILAVVLLAGLIMLIVRALTLSILMILSPLGFAAFAIPPLEKYGKMWWDKLLSQAFFAPVYLLFIFIGLKIAQGMSGGSLNLMQALTTPTSTTTGSIFTFTILSGFMIMALVVAKQMGAMGAGFATGIAGKAIGTAVVGTTGFVGRRTIGAGSQRLAEKINKSEFGRTRTGQMFIGGFNRVAKSSFDARATSAGSSIGGIDFGKAGGKGGYQHELHEKEAARMKASKDLKLSAGEQRELDEREAAHNEATAKLQERHKEAQAPAKAKIAALQEKMKNMPEGDARKAVVEELRAEQETLKGLREEQNEEKAAMTSAYEKATQKTKDAPQREYADRLHTPVGGGIPIIGGAVGVGYNYLTLRGHADHHAVEKIKSELKKKPEDRAADAKNQALLDALNKASHGGGDHGGGGGGGGGGGHAAPKAAASGGGHGH